MADECLLLNRVVPGLRDAVNAGAHAQIWATVAAAIPRLVPPAVGTPPRLLADLLALGVDLAETGRPGNPLPCLDPIAARRGSSQLTVQARRLRAALSTPD